MPARAKYYLPEEPDGWEAGWFDRGDDKFPLQAAAGVKVGFQLCTELLFSQAAWEIGHAAAGALTGLETRSASSRCRAYRLRARALW